RDRRRAGEDQSAACEAGREEEQEEDPRTDGERSMRMGAALAVAAIVVITCPAPARADSQAEARTLMREGNRLLEAGDYRGALDMYQAAYARVPSVKILLNMGTALRQLGRNAEAANAYARYCNDPASDATRRAEVASLIAEIDRGVGRVLVQVNEATARVSIDGKPVEGSATTRTVRVEPGTHVVGAENDGFAAV